MTIRSVSSPMFAIPPLGDRAAGTGDSAAIRTTDGAGERDVRAYELWVKTPPRPDLARRSSFLMMTRDEGARDRGEDGERWLPPLAASAGQREESLSRARHGWCRVSAIRTGSELLTRANGRGSPRKGAYPDDVDAPGASQVKGDPSRPRRRTPAMTDHVEPAPAARRQDKACARHPHRPTARTPRAVGGEPRCCLRAPHNPTRHGSSARTGRGATTQ